MRRTAVLSDAALRARSELAARCRAVLENWRRGRARRRAATPTRGRAPTRYPWQWYWDSCFAAIVWRRFDPRALASRARDACSPRMRAGRLHRPHDLLGPAGLAAGGCVYYNVTSRRRRDDRDDPAAAARLGLADRGRRPGRGAADRRPPRVAARQPRPRGRRAAVDRPARRVGPRLLAEVRPGLGPAGARAARLPAAGRAATGGSAGTRGGSATRRAGALRGGDQRALVPRAAWRRASRRSPRRWSTGSGTSGAGSSSTRRSPAARAQASRPGPPSPRSRCPTCPRRSAAGWSRSTCSTRSATG